MVSHFLMRVGRNPDLYNGSSSHCRNFLWLQLIITWLDMPNMLSKIVFSAFQAWPGHFCQIAIIEKVLTFSRSLRVDEYLQTNHPAIARPFIPRRSLRQNIVTHKLEVMQPQIASVYPVSIPIREMVGMSTSRVDL